MHSFFGSNFGGTRNNNKITCTPNIYINIPKKNPAVLRHTNHVEMQIESARFQCNENKTTTYTHKIPIILHRYSSIKVMKKYPAEATTQNVTDKKLQTQIDNRYAKINNKILRIERLPTAVLRRCHCWRSQDVVVCRRI